jgi:hypothetical protein
MVLAQIEKEQQKTDLIEKAKPLSSKRFAKGFEKISSK